MLDCHKIQNYFTVSLQKANNQFQYYKPGSKHGSAQAQDFEPSPILQITNVVVVGLQPAWVLEKVRRIWACDVLTIFIVPISVVKDKKLIYSWSQELEDSEDVLDVVYTS